MRLARSDTTSYSQTLPRICFQFHFCRHVACTGCSFSYHSKMLKATLILGLVAAVAAKELVATVDLVPDSKYLPRNVSGHLTFVQAGEGSPVVITGTITGLDSNAKHGFHIHEKGNITGGCLSTGAHFNPHKVNHGTPEADSAGRHVGDLGNIQTDNNGVAVINITDTMISLSGENKVAGLAVVVHAKEDDLGTGDNDDSKKTGNAGDRWSCGIITLSNSALSVYQTGYIILLSAIAVLFTASP